MDEFPATLQNLKNLLCDVCEIKDKFEYTTITGVSFSKKGVVIMGTYKLSGKNKLELSAVASTRAFCPNQTQEDQYIQELGKVDAYQINGDLLSLMSDGKTIMVLQAQAPSDTE